MPIANALIADPSPPGPGTPPTPGVPAIFFNGTDWITQVPPGGSLKQAAGSSVPTAAAHSGSSNTSVSVQAGSNDNRGVILFTSAGSPVGGAQIDVTFGQAKSSAPYVFLMAQTQATATTLSSGFIATGTTATAQPSATGFSITCRAADLTATTAYVVAYNCVG